MKTATLFFLFVSICLCLPAAADDESEALQHQARTSAMLTRSGGKIEPDITLTGSCSARAALICPRTVNASMTQSCLDTTFESSIDPYTFAATSGQSISISMSSSVFPVYIALYDPNGFYVKSGVITSYLSSGTSSNLLTYSVPVSGTYTILAQTLYGILLPDPFLSPLTGPYSLTITGCNGAVSGACVRGGGNVCLLSNRFRVTVAWNDQHSPGHTGVGTDVADTDQTGFFWFFSSESKELVVKVVDGRGLNGKFWFFYGALSDVEYDITVTDTTNGHQRVYHNAPGSVSGGADTSAF